MQLAQAKVIQGQQRQVSPYPVRMPLDYQAKLFYRDAPINSLKEDFGDLVQVTELLARTSLFYKRKIQLTMIKVDVELIRFAVLVDGVEQHVIIPTNG